MVEGPVVSFEQTMAMVTMVHMLSILIIVRYLYTTTATLGHADVILTFVEPSRRRRSRLQSH
jgi:hypothetical protein